MSTPWLDVFDEVNRILRSIGPLFEGCDRLLHDHGFEPSHGQRNRVESESRSHIQEPWGWYPGWFARRYRHHHDSRTFYVAIFLHDCGGKEDYRTTGPRLEEPLVTAGVLRYNGVGQWQHWHCKTWFWNANAVVGGPPVTSEFDDPGKKYVGEAQTFAVRLVDICSKQDIASRIVTPLVKLAGM